MKCYRLYKQPAEELYLFARTYHAKLYECEVYKYDGLISYDIIDNNVCNIHNLEEIKMYSDKCLRSVSSPGHTKVK